MNMAPNFGNFLHAHMPYVSAVTDTILRTKDGDFVISLEVQGLTASMLDDREVDAAMQNFDMMLQSFNPRCGIYIHKIINDAKHLKPGKSTDNAFASAIDERWYEHLNSSGLKTRKIIVTFCFRPNVNMLSRFGSVFGASGDSQADTHKLVAELRAVAKHFETIVHPRTCKTLKLSDGSLLGFLGKLVGRRASTILPAKTSGPITAPIVADSYVFHDDYFIIKEQNSRHRYGRSMSIKNYCPTTWATVLDRLEMPMDMVITNSYTPCSPTKALRLLKSTGIAMSSAEDDRLSDQAQLIEARDEIASRRVGFGKHHLSVVIFQDTKEALDDLTSITRAGCEEVGLTMVNEASFAKEVFFAQFPANYNYRSRKEYITSKNFSNFSAIHALPTGREADETPWGDIVTHFPDIVGSPYAFNFHERWAAPREPSPGHTVIVGAQDSGKSTLAAFLAGQAIRSGARVFVFDKDNSLEMAVRAYGGKYTNLHAGEPTGLNPFATEIDKDGVNWLAGWLEALLFGGAELSEDQSKRLFEILNDNASAPQSLQNFSGFTPEFVSLDDEGLMHSRLMQWCKDGQFAWAFEAGEGKEFTLDDRVMGFDFTELLDKPKFRTPILAYILRLIERSIKDREPTLIIIDEAWKMLDDTYFVKILKEWMVTMRKKNVAVVMMSQIVSHFSTSGIAASISENMNTKIIFPNASADPEGYKFFGFNDKQCEIATTATGGMRLALIQSGEDRTMLNVDLSALGSYVTALGGGKAGENKYGKDWREHDLFWKENS